MTMATTIDKAGPRRNVKLRSMSHDRKWALRWSYVFLTMFAIFFLFPPIYTLITSLKAAGARDILEIPISKIIE